MGRSEALRSPDLEVQMRQRRVAGAADAAKELPQSTRCVSVTATDARFKW